MKNGRIAILLSILLAPVLIGQPADCVSLTFDADGVLPSSEGFLYQGTIPEAQAFAVSAGKLQLNTLGSGAIAFYVLPNAFDPARDFELEFQVRVFSVTGPFGLDFEISDDTYDFEFGLMENGVFLPPPGRPFLPLGTSAGETHTYRVTSVAGSSAYDLFVDGLPVIAGTIAAGGDPGMRFAFGDGTGGADSHAEIDDVRFCQPASARTVSIDIKPGSDPNTIQLRANGRLPVAILGTDTFAVTAVNPATVTLAGALVASRPNGSLFASLEDVDDDGHDDLVLHFATAALQLAPGDTTAVLSGYLHDGTAISGQDSVRVNLH